MGIKKIVAKPALGFHKFWNDGIRVTDGFGPVVLSVVFGVAAGLSSGPVQDALRPVENTPLAGQEQALQQYDAVLTTLAEQHKTLTGRTQLTQPGALSELLGEAAATEQTADMDNVRKSYDSQLEKFVTAVAVDERLNEADIQNLLTRFESEHGKITDVTGFEAPDYDDISESRAATISIQNEKERAIAVFGKSNDTNSSLAGDLGSGIGALLLPWLLYMGIGAGRRRLESWEQGKSAPRKSGFNH
ncbi:MAG: hypothetical protein EP349_08980 [Alphaproteobacteria bacterium]|nr:MAG: hypothetical protein EP349_08980 [Alphaproteobacteria bacterium]